MAERERRAVGSGFQSRAQILGPDDVSRALTRIAHEIVERNQGVERLVIVGLQTGGVALADSIAERISRHEGVEIPAGRLDVALHRDDHRIRPVVPGAVSRIPVDIEGSTVVLVDDVLFTGRTIRAALDALHDYGRPRAVQLAVMVDRGHRELPIRPDFVGKNLPTRLDEAVDVSLDGVTIGDLA